MFYLNYFCHIMLFLLFLFLPCLVLFNHIFKMTLLPLLGFELCNLYHFGNNLTLKDKLFFY